MSNKARPEAYTSVMLDIGQRIKWARELVEPNRAAFARVMGVDRTTIQKIEDGRRAPSIFNVIEISERLRISPTYILTGSLEGVEWELATRLAARHPELAPQLAPPTLQRGANGTAHMAKGGGTCRPPRRPIRA